MSDIRDFQFRDQLAQVSPSCETSFLFRDTPDLQPLTCAFNFRDQENEIVPFPCGGEFWETPDGEFWETPDGEFWAVNNE